MAIDNTMQQNYTRVPVEYNRKTKAKILEVKKLDASVKTEVGKYGNYENRSLVLRLGIKTIASPLENVISVEMVDAQTSLDSGLNPSDYYFRANTLCKPGASVGVGNPEFVEIELEYSIDQRPASGKDQPWEEPLFMVNSSVRHLSFDSGMMNGFNRWQMYKLDFTKLRDVKFEFVKQFTYVQGQVVDQ